MVLTAITFNDAASALDNGATPSTGTIAITGTATCGGVPVEGAWTFTSATELTASKNVGVTFTPANETAYNSNTGTVYVYVKAVTPSPLTLVSTELDTITLGKVKFDTASFTNLQYKIGENGTWTAASATEFAANVDDKIYFKTVAHGTDGEDGYVVDSDESEPTTVTESNIGTKVIRLAAPTPLSNVALNMELQTLAFDQYTDAANSADADKVDSYLVKFYQESTLIATATLNEDALYVCVASVVLENGKSFDYSKDCNAKIMAVAAGGTGYSDSLETAIATEEFTISDQATVTFNVNGGSAVSPVKLKKATTVTKPADPTRDGYVFVGWYTYEDVEFDFDTPIEANTTLYAFWSKVLDPASPAVKFTWFDESVPSEGSSISDDETRYLSAIANNSNVAYDAQTGTYTLTGALKAENATETDDGKRSDIPVFLTFDLENIEYNGLTSTAKGQQYYVWYNDDADWDAAYAPYIRMDEVNHKLYVKFGRILMNKDCTAYTGKTEYVFKILNGVTDDPTSQGYEVARLTFAIDSQVTFAGE